MGTRKGAHGGMKKQLRCLAGMLCLLLVWLFLPFDCAHAAREPRHILYISSYSYSWETVPRQINGIRRALNGMDYVINYEFMDTKNTMYSEGYREYYELLRYKLHSRYRYDGVIVGDDAALNFVERYREELFADAPITFLAVDNLQKAARAARDPGVTGIVEQMDYCKNIEVARKLLPGATHVTFILDNMENGVGIAQQLAKQREAFSGYQVNYLNTSELTREALCRRLASFTEKDIVFCISMGQLKDGVILTENERYQLIREYASAPLFCLTTAGVGDGMLGGYVVDFEQSGFLAASMLKQMLEHPGQSVPTMRYDTPGMYYFDNAVMKQYNLALTALPQDAIVRNLPESIWRTHSSEIIIGLLLSMLTAFAVFVYVLQKARKKLESNNRKLIAADRAKTDFLSNMSHDMRTPMNAILGITALLHDRTDPVDIHRDVAQIEQSGQYLLRLINDTLDMSKIESGKMELHPVIISRKTLADNILLTSRILAEQKGVHFVVELPPADSKVWTTALVDASRIEQIFVNLLSNAIKFTPRGGVVKLRMETLSMTDTAFLDRFIISDTGIGMSKAFQEHLFEPFSQEGRANTGHENGTGLGLAIVKRIVDLMGGTIRLESERDRGTTVMLELPSLRCSDTASIPQPEEADLSILQGKYVLLCEDHPINAEIAGRLLELRGVTTECAENGQLGVALFAKTPENTFDAILMDIRMPVMNGMEATRAIRALAGRTDATTIPIIAMTANTFDEDVRQCQQAGMNEHLCKPIDPKCLYETLARMLAAKQ